MVFQLLTVLAASIAVGILAVRSKPKRVPVRSRAGFIGSLVGAFSDGGKGEALGRMQAAENAAYYYGDRARNRLQEEQARIGGDLGAEQGLRGMERGRVLSEALGQRQQLGGMVGMGQNATGALNHLIMNPGQLSAGGQFQMQEAARAVGNQSAGMGMRMSGAAMQALQDRAQGIAQTDRASQVQQLLSTIGAGQNAIGMQRFAGPAQDYVSQLLNARTNTAGNLANAVMTQGQNVAGINSGMANVITGSTAGKNQMISGGLNILGGGMISAAQQKMGGGK